MDERVVQFRVGFMVLVTLIIGLFLIWLFGEMPAFVHGTYTIRMRFPQAPGVTQDTPVRKSGILVGRVTRIDFDEEGGVVVSATIDADRQLRRNEECRIKASLLGDSVIEFNFAADKDLPNDLIQDGDTVEGILVKDPLEAISNLETRVALAVDSFNTTSSEIGQLAKQLREIMDSNDGQFSRIAEKTESALDALQKTMTNADDLLGDEEIKKGLQKSLKDLPQTLQDVHDVVEIIEKTSQSMQKTFALVDKNLEHIEGFTGPLGEKGEQMINRLDGSLGRLESVFEELDTFTKKLNSSEGSIARLINDPELYDNISAAAANIKQLTRDLKPILRDARIFSDKISRHPEQLGVRGAIQKSTGIKD